MIHTFFLSLTLSACTISDRPAQCGTLVVPEHRAAPDGRRIPLRLIVVRGKEPRRSDPVVFIAGGPGQGAATVAEFVMTQLAGIDQNRDVVLVDQRGTGGSNPLTCTAGFDLLAPGRETDLDACRTLLQERADLTRYGTTDAVEDLEAVRAALGYESMNLFGVSYGTRAAFQYVRRYPARVRTLILRSVAPAGFNIITDGGRTAQDALAQVFRDCDRDHACAAAFGNLAEPFERLRAQLQSQPVSITVDAAPQKPIVVTEMLLSQTLYALLLSADSRQMIPLLVHRAVTQGVQALGPVLVNVVGQLYGSVSFGMYLSVVCGEDAARVTPAERARLRGTNAAVTASMVDICARWPTANVPTELHRPVVADTPTLLFSGSLDPATSVAAGDEAARHLSRSRHFVIPATAHAPILPGCVAGAVKRFLDEASVSAIDAGCLADIKLKPFTIPPAK